MSTLKVNTLQTAAGVEVYTAKAWVNFNGTGTVAIRGSGNVSSITDNGTGDYTVNFTNAMTDANYSVSINGTVRGDTSSSSGVFQIQNIAGGVPITPALMSTTQIRISIKSSSSSSSWDSPTVCVAIFR
jgi:hypothetical protein